MTIDPVTTEDAAHARRGRRRPEVRADPPRGHSLHRGGAPGDLPRHPENQARRGFPEDLRVIGFGKDAGSEIGRDMAIYGKDGDLDTIARSKETHLRVMSFTEPATGELHITLHDPQPQTALQDILDARPRDGHRPLDHPAERRRAGLSRLDGAALRGEDHREDQGGPRDRVQARADPGERGAGGDRRARRRRSRRTGPPSRPPARSSSS